MPLLVPIAAHATKFVERRLERVRVRALSCRCREDELGTDALGKFRLTLLMMVDNYPLIR
jgi:hypothetical protein